MVAAGSFADAAADSMEVEGIASVKFGRVACPLLLGFGAEGAGDAAGGTAAASFSSASFCLDRRENFLRMSSNFRLC